MATAPGITAPRVAPGGGGLGAGIRAFGASLKRKAERERKEREIFEKMTLQNDVDRSMRAALDALPPEATPLDRFNAIQDAGAAVVGGYGDQDPKKGQQANEWYRKTWAGKYRSKAETWQNERNEEALKGQYAATQQSYQLRVADALRRSVSAGTEAEQQAAAVEYQTLTQEMTDLARLVDPDVAGEQLADWNRQHPIDAMVTLEEEFAARGQLTDFQARMRRGEFKQFRSRIAPEERKRMDEALSSRIATEARKRTQLINAQEASEKRFQADLRTKYATLGRTMPTASLRAQMTADGASEKTINLALGDIKTGMEYTEAIDDARSLEGMQAASNAWVDTLAVGSALEAIDAYQENDRRLRQGLINDDMHSQAEDAIKRQAERVQLIGAENAQIWKDTRRRFMDQIGLKATVDEWSDAKNLRLARFTDMSNEVQDVWDATGGEGGREALEALFKLGMAGMVIHDQLDLTQSNLAPGVELEEDPALRRQQEKDWARGFWHQMQSLITREGWVESAPLEELTEVIAERTGQGSVQLTSHTKYTEVGGYDREGTVAALESVPGLTEPQRANARLVIEEHVNAAMHLKGLAGFKTMGRIRQEREDILRAAESERKLGEEQAAAAEAQAQEAEARRVQEAEDARRAQRQAAGRAQTFAMPDDAPGAMVPLTPQEARPEQTAMFEKRKQQRQTFEQRRLEQRARLGPREGPRHRGQMGRRRR